jgi:uncharacterized membrane protein YgcG
VDAAARKSLAENRAQIAELRERCLAALAEAERAFQEAVPHHKEDLALLDVVRVACDKAAFAAAKVSEEDARLKASLEATAAYFGKVAMGRSKARDPVTHDRETTAEKVLQTLASFRVALLKRCRALEIVDPATAFDHASVAIELDDPERTKAADRGSRNEEGVSSGEEGVSPDGAPGEAEEGEAAEAGQKEETVSLSDSARVSAAVETARAAIAAAGDAYFAAKNPERPSTRPDSVPESEGGAEALVKTKRDVLRRARARRLEAPGRRGGGASVLRRRYRRDAWKGAGGDAHTRARNRARLRGGGGSRGGGGDGVVAARDVSSRRSEHKDRMRPGIAHPGRKLELAALLASERTRAEDAARVIENENAKRVKRLRRVRRRRNGRAGSGAFRGSPLSSRAASWFRRTFVSDGPGAEMEQAARRKNLKQLRVERLKRQNAADAERRDDSKRANVKLRSWAHLDVAETTPESAPGHEPFDVAKALPPLAPLENATHGAESDGKSGAEAPDAGADEEAPKEATDDANGDEENVAEEADPDASPVWAADVPSVRALMDARDVAWRDFTAACRDAYARHAAATARRVADEVAHRQVWDELVARAREGRAR